MDRKYLFTSARLGFRCWQKTDTDAMAKINADANVREFFPGIQNYEQTAQFIHRMQQMFADKGYCYYAVDKLDEQEFIGFIGLAEQTFEASFTPCTDIGWRLCKKEWNKGYATEGAQACLGYAFHTLLLPRVYSMAPKINLKSIHVMEKIGMVKVADFIHPLLLSDKRLKECVVYEIMKEQVKRE